MGRGALRSACHGEIASGFIVASYAQIKTIGLHAMIVFIYFLAIPYPKYNSREGTLTVVRRLELSHISLYQYPDRHSKCKIPGASSRFMSLMLLLPEILAHH